MAKKDTYLALLRRGVDETTAMTLADSGLKIGEIRKLDQDQLVQNYGLKAEIARSVLEVLQSGSTSSGKERYLSNVLSGPDKKPMDKIEEQRFKRQQKENNPKPPWTGFALQFERQSAANGIRQLSFGRILGKV